MRKKLKHLIFGGQFSDAKLREASPVRLEELDYEITVTGDYGDEITVTVH